MKISDCVMWGDLGEEIVLLSLDSGIYFSLGGVGGHFWKLLSEGLAVEAILQQLENQYEVEAGVVRKDIDSLVSELAAEGLILGVE